MTDIIISFRSVNALLDCFIFTKELSRVTFDKTIQVIFNFQHFDLDGALICDDSQNVTKHLHTSLITKHVHCEASGFKFEDCVIHQAKNIISTNYSDEEDEDETLFLCVQAEQRCTLLMDAHLASCVSKYLTKDFIFRNGFLKFVKYVFGFTLGIDFRRWIDNYGDFGYLNTHYIIDIVSIWPRQKIDFQWYSRIHHLVRKRCQLEENMAWLSTLGGGYSSLGDYFTNCAEKAGKISIHQLKLAIEMSDPIMASKCRVFWAQSLLQQNRLRLCKTIVWNEYKFATTNGIKDTKLENMCLSVWNKLKYLYKLKILRKHQNSKS